MSTCQGCGATSTQVAGPNAQPIARFALTAKNWSFCQSLSEKATSATCSPHYYSTAYPTPRTAQPLH